MRTVFPVKYYKDEGFVERKIELDDNDLQEIIQDWLIDNAASTLTLTNRNMSNGGMLKCRYPALMTEIRHHK
ncbi:hypothetical protein [Hafnia paralvei]|uniref:hypothetical protein n=1 Tax=Hafnia paralvei TaxID=546367 RepID=UPI001D181564|nr:hypothetical protein [Hafnia paralvei]